MGWRGMEQGDERAKSIFVMENPLKERPDYAGDAAMLVSICSYEEGIPRGVFICFEYNQIYEFQGLDQMLLKMEDIMDGLSVPRPAFEHRSFYGKPYISKETEPGQRMSERIRCPEDMPRLLHGKASFELKICRRQHGSMQGEITAVISDESGEKMEKKVLFRSALELMRLIHEYLDKGA